MARPGSALAVAERIAAAFDAVGIDSAIGRALALGVWGYTRDTEDVDLTAYVGMEELERVFGLFQSLGAEVERGAAMGSWPTGGISRCLWTRPG